MTAKRFTRKEYAIYEKGNPICMTLRDVDVRLNELWEEKNVRGTICACHTAWKLIDEAFKSHMYSDEKFKDVCNFNNGVIGCIYPQYSAIEKLLLPRTVRI